MLHKKLFFLLLISMLSLIRTSSVSASTIQIYPSYLDPSTAPRLNYNYSPQQTCGTSSKASDYCQEKPYKVVCYDAFPWKDDGPIIAQEQPDGIYTYKQTRGTWWNYGFTDGCQAVNWGGASDNTRNHPTESVNFVDQTIVIPAGVTKITRVKFYNITTDSTNNLVIALYPSSRGEYPISGNIGAVPSSSQVTSLGGTSYAVDFQNIPDWDVTAGTTYYLRFKNANNDNLSVPVSSNCASCVWHITSTESHSPDSATPHNQTDAYPQGKAYSGYRPGTGPITRSVYFDDIKGSGADLARLAVWGEIITPASPLNLTASCPAPGTAATVKWEKTVGATSYNLRVSDSSDAPGWNPACSPTNPNDVCLDGLPGTSYTTANSQPSHTYGWWLHACNSSGCSNPSGGPNFTCTATSSPTSVKLDSLTMGSALTPSITSGAAKTLGRTEEEKGSNWYNPMDVSLTASGGIDNTTQYYVAFYDKKQGTGTVKTAYLSLDPVKQLLKNHPEYGFIFRYDVSGSKYYVWDQSRTSGYTDCTNNGCFVDITSFTLEGYPIYNSSGAVLYRAYPNLEKLPPTWQIKIMAAFGSKNMYTPGYVINSSSSDFNPDMDPVVIPPSAVLPASTAAVVVSSTPASSVAVIPAIKQLIFFYFQQLLALL